MTTRLKKIGYLLAALAGTEGYGQSFAPADTIAWKVQLDTAVVVSLSPLGGGTDRYGLPIRVQAARGVDLKNAQSTDLTDFLNKNFGSVHVNEAGGNPLQPDLSYRGFQASPLLGLPQGLSVYQDGVRINELFGDVVNWDLLPEAALAEVELVSGSNPVFGLNTLGGALSMRTKSGFTHPERSLSLSGGRFGRVLAEGTAGGRRGNFAYFVSGNHFRERGWRDYSQSHATQLFGKGSYADERNRLHAALTVSGSRLRGNGASPFELLAEDRAAVFTHPDLTRNGLTQFTLNGTRLLARGISLSANGYLRRKETRTFNGDHTHYEALEDGSGYLALEDTGHPTRDQFGRPVAATDEVLTAVNNTSRTRETTAGATLQLAVNRPAGGRENHLVAGLTYDGGTARFGSETELARLTEERGTVGSGRYDGASFTRVNTTAHKLGLFVSETHRLSRRLSVVASARLDHSTLRLRDQLGTALNGYHVYTRLNPALGAVYRRGVGSFYANASLATRTPTPVELTCADPNAPCRLPNAFLADPPLRLVVARTLEGGWRGTLRPGYEWNTTLFLTRLRNDIYFISAGPGRNSGYFTNLGGSARAGAELSLSRTVGKLRWQLHYTYLRATFRDDFTVTSAAHPEAEDGEIRVRRGDRIPLVPAHLLKGSLWWQASPRWGLGGDLLHNGRQYLRGDEANLLEPLPGYVLLGLRGQYAPHKRLLLSAKCNNVLNARYATFGLLGEPDETEDFESFTDPRFLTPGQPFYAQLGLEYTFR